MLYDLGRMNWLEAFAAKALVVGVILGTIGALCVSLSIAVRIGNFILGF